MRHLLPLLLLTLSIAACGDRGDEAPMQAADQAESETSSGTHSMTKPGMAPPPGDEADKVNHSQVTKSEEDSDRDVDVPVRHAVDTTGSAVIDRMIIRTGHMDLRVGSLDSAERALIRIVTAQGGYTSNTSRMRGVGSTLTGSIELRVPATNFRGTLDAIRALGKVESETISASDVTQEFIDQSARLRTQQQLEQRILRLLNERTGKLAEIIELEEKLAQIRSEIEGVQGRLRYLENQVGYSTLTVRMFEPGAVGTSQTETFGGELGRAFRRGVDGLVELLGGLITLLITLLPLILIGIAIWFIFVRPWLRRRRVKAVPVQVERGEDV